MKHERLVREGQIRRNLSCWQKHEAQITIQKGDDEMPCVSVYIAPPLLPPELSWAAKLLKAMKR